VRTGIVSLPWKCRAFQVSKQSAWPAKTSDLDSLHRISQAHLPVHLRDQLRDGAAGVIRIPLDVGEDLEALKANQEMR